MRLTSLLLASAVSLIGLVFPFVLGLRATGLNQSILLVTMFGIAGAFIHGAGFAPKNMFLREIIAPMLTWPLMIGGFVALIALR